jgi:hypothetical protein
VTESLQTLLFAKQRLQLLRPQVLFLHKPLQLQVAKTPACSVGWWLMAGAGLF